VHELKSPVAVVSVRWWRLTIDTKIFIVFGVLGWYIPFFRVRSLVWRDRIGGVLGRLGRLGKEGTEVSKTYRVARITLHGENLSSMSFCPQKYDLGLPHRILLSQLNN
jgi:hypothetical protein